MKVTQFLIDNLSGNCIVYSGRGMMGKQCLGVMYDDISDFIQDIITFGRDGDFSSVYNLDETLQQYKQDNMGRRTVIYFPQLDLTDKQISYLSK